MTTSREATVYRLAIAGISVGWVLFGPLMLLAVPAQYLFGLFPGRPWQAVAPLHGVWWAVLSGYSATVVGVAAGMPVSGVWHARLRAWAVTAVAYVGIQVVDVCAEPVLVHASGGLGNVVRAVLLLASVVLGLLLLPASAITRSCYCGSTGVFGSSGV